jgi:hypothetical protein
LLGISVGGYRYVNPSEKAFLQNFGLKCFDKLFPKDLPMLRVIDGSLLFIFFTIAITITIN